METRWGLRLLLVMLAYSAVDGEGQVRLVGGSGPHEGRVEVYHNGVWGTVCDNNWDLQDAMVVCRQLGYGTAVGAIGLAAFGEGTGPIWYDDVSCSGHEANLTQCGHRGLGVHNCGHWEDTGVICANLGIRLVGGSGPYEGRVEIYHNGVWGSVCDDDWDLQDAMVVCRQLGYINAAAAVGPARFGSGSGPILFSELSCVGNESTITECDHRSTGGHNCSQSRDVGVVCEGEGQVRLVGGSGPHEGRVEVNHNGVWGTVCDNNWDLQDAMVVCRQLGYGTAVGALVLAAFGRGSGQIWYVDVNCSGHEANLTQCGHRGLEVHSCGHSEDAGVICTSIRLVGGSGPHEGRVEIYHNGTWGGTVCDDDWDLQDAMVVCHQLGYINATAAVGPARFGSGSGPILFSELSCFGNESTITECDHRSTGGHNCSHSQDVGAVCEGEGQVQLVGGSGPHEGRVEVYHFGVWGTVCDYNWDLQDAMVVCRQLGYGTAMSAPGRAAFGRGSGPIWYDGVHCSGHEANLTQCGHRGLGVHNCGHWEDAGVICTNIRLVGGSGPFEGRVEVYHNGVWGTVCDDDWDLQDAMVVCRQLGYINATAAVEPARFGSGSGPILFSELSCVGNESTITECDHRSTGGHNCSHSQDAGVVCEVAVRLAGGSSEPEGRVEVYLNGEWGTVCGWSWDPLEGKVVCRQLGYKGVNRTYSYTSQHNFGEGTGWSWLSGLRCTGSEANLLQCPHDGVGNGCPHHWDVGVVCTNEDLPDEGDIRLVGGSVPSEGRVELFYEGEWRSVGNVVGGTTAVAAARVACRQVGYPFSNGTRDFGQGSGPVWAVIWQCTGGEERVEQCLHYGWRSGFCFSCNVLGISCRGAENGPFNVTIEATPLSVFIEWMELSDNIPLVTGYNITVENLITKKVRTVHVEGSSGEANVSGLTPLTEYSFTVAAVYQYGLGPPSKTVIQRTGEQEYPQCSFKYCKRKKNSLCTKSDAVGSCTCKVTSCKATYFAMNEREAPAKCSRRNKCAGLSGDDLESCLKKWGNCVKRAFKKQYGKTPRCLRNKNSFKCLEYPCSG